MGFFYYYVEVGDTLLSLCARHRSRVREFVELNNLYPLRELVVGEKVKIPYRHPYKYYHLVQYGETLEQIAARYHTTPQLIAMENMVEKAPPGQMLYIPEVRVKLARPHTKTEETADDYFYQPVKYMIDDIRKVALREQIFLLQPLLGQDIRLREFTYKAANQLAYVDLSDVQISRGLGSQQEMAIYHVLLEALLPYREIKYVQFMVNGNVIESPNGHVDLSEPLDMAEYLQNE
ncbi:MAG: LysM peptidoglycan-binding domain-containing protein [Desulfurispora sp.]|uniref:LysM peptidoglycan-binding domain-containing protein n=1 Tax=Desulfurispora sp. TaxID=3014275 RepID=UPI00404B6631